MFPYEDPEIIVYVAVSKISNSNLLTEATKTLIEDVSTYLGIVETKVEEESSYTLPSLINKNITDLAYLNDLNIDIVTIGNGDKVIKQYPSKGNILNANDKLFLLTNSTENKYTNIEGWSKNDLKEYSKLLGVNFTFTGYGYSKGVNLNGRTVVKGETIEITLEPKYIEKKEDNSTNSAE